MNRYELEKRLRELGIYSDFCFRKELKVIPQLLGEKEQLNCFAGALAAKGVTVIQRGAVREYAFEKKLLFSRLSFSTNNGAEFVFTNTQGSLKELFEWAMQRPLPAGD